MQKKMRFLCCSFLLLFLTFVFVFYFFQSILRSILLLKNLILMLESFFYLCVFSYSFSYVPQYTDGPNDSGEMFTRPGKLTDYLPKPYPNEEAARFANNGALPPSLTLLVGARNAGSNYIFSLLTGYDTPPIGVTLAENMSYNPYFSGGQIAMPPPLSDEMLEFDDGTPASICQMAKDVSHFMEWSMAPMWNEDKSVELKKAIVLLTLSGLAFYYNRQRWSVIKTRQIRRF